MGLAPLFWPNPRHPMPEQTAIQARRGFVELCIDVMRAAHTSWLKQAGENPTHCSSAAFDSVLLVLGLT